ncbi:MAG TPA: O-antigen ligase family protein, partial [Gemmataceae bacterium]|nr:O-antigen ligase family protein [Gemmataceae bacterium]
AERWWMRAAAFGCAAVLGHAVLISFSRGGMLGMIITGGIAFLLIRKRPWHYVALAAAVAAALALSGPELRHRFMTMFAGEAERDPSAASRLQLWAACCDVMARMPVLGAGPDHWPTLSESYGFTPMKEAHTLWLQWGAEMGLPGLGFLVLYYGLCAARLWPLARRRDPAADPWEGHMAAMVIASLAGFAVSAQFVSMKLLEPPYYIALVGAGTLKLASARAAVSHAPSNPMLVPGSLVP